MPYRWTDPAATTPEPPLARLRLEPHQSLSPEGFVGFMAATLGFILLPLIAVLGTPILWAILPFFAAAIAGVWFAIHQSRRAAQLTEELTFWPNRLELVRISARGARQDWEANPHWVSLHLHPEGGPVENYLTLKGGGREVELGAFLSPEERAQLHGTLEEKLAQLKGFPGP